MTFAQRGTSDLIRSPNCSGVPVRGSTPCFMNLSVTSAVAMIFCDSALRRRMMSRGVPAGARSPNHTDTS